MQEMGDESRLSKGILYESTPVVFRLINQPPDGRQISVTDTSWGVLEASVALIVTTSGTGLAVKVLMSTETVTSSTSSPVHSPLVGVHNSQSASSDKVQ
jgi:hypothetical protein